MVKVFDSEISNNYIQGFTTGILLEGCDLNTVRDNNILNFSKYAICDLAFGDFGSQNTIVHNDLLDFRGGASDKGSFIKSNSRHIIIRDNYLESNEQAHQLFAYIDCSKVGLPVRDNYTNFSKQIDITGNRCDIQSNNYTKYMFYINEKFKSLHLNEIPNLNANFTNGSSFGQDTYEELPIDYIRVKIIDTENWDKVINMQNCESFKNWKNFSTSKQFSQGSNGDIIIDTKNISYVSNRGDYLCQKFNPRSFLLEPGNSIFIKIDQKNESLLGDLFKNVKFKIKIRNLSNVPDVNTNDVYFALKTTTTSANFTTPLFYVSPIDIPNDKNYSVIEINTPTNFAGFDPTKDYYIQIHGANSIKEIKEIIIENKQPIIANENKNSLIENENLKNKHTKNLKINSSIEDSKSVPLTEKETTRTLTVKVDNSIVAFPNPVKNNLTIDIKDGDTIKSIAVFSEIGTFIKDFTNELSNNTIDFSALPNATYLVKIVTLTSTTKVILKD